MPVSTQNNIEGVQLWTDHTYPEPRRLRHLPFESHVTTPRPSWESNAECRVRVALGHIDAGQKVVIEGVVVARSHCQVCLFRVENDLPCGFETAVETIMRRVNQ